MRWAWELRFRIKNVHVPTQSRGMRGTQGQRNDRTRSGLWTRRRRIPIATIANAMSVPMFTSSATMARGKKPATQAVSIPVTRMTFTGVRVFSLTSEKNPGRRPSRDMAKKIRLCPKSMTRITEVMPQSAPIETINAPQEIPILPSAKAIGALIALSPASSANGTMPVRTMPSTI